MSGRCKISFDWNRYMTYSIDYYFLTTGRYSPFLNFVLHSRIPIRCIGFYQFGLHPYYLHLKKKKWKWNLIFL